MLDTIFSIFWGIVLVGALHHLCSLHYYQVRD